MLMNVEIHPIENFKDNAQFGNCGFNTLKFNLKKKPKDTA